MPETFEPGAHPCEVFACKKIVPFDDEPYCFNHSDDGGSFVLGYSYEKTHQ